MSVVVTKFLYPRFSESITMARHPGRAMACQTLSSQLLQPQKQLFITGEGTFGSWQRPAAAWQTVGRRPQQKGFPHPTDRMCLPMLRPLYTQSGGKETPCGKSPSHTRVGAFAFAGISLSPAAVTGSSAGLRTTLAVGEPRGPF